MTASHPDTSLIDRLVLCKLRTEVINERIWYLHQQGWLGKEIAAELGLTPEMVAARLYRLRKKHR